MIDRKDFLNKYSDIVLAVVVVAIVGMMIVPLPTLLLDVLLTFNISIADTELVPENLDSLDRVAAFVERKTRGQAPCVA